MSKEDILKQLNCKGKFNVKKSKCFEAMDLYAEQQSIEFAEWQLRNGYQSVQWLKDKYFTNDFSILNYKTPSQLYQLFLNQSK